MTRSSTPSSGRTGPIAGATLAIGAVLLRRALTSPKGGPTFRHRTVALAATWAGGAALTGQFAGDRWRVRTRADVRDRVLRPAATAAAAAAVFSAGAVAVAKIPVLRREIDTVLDHAQRGPLPTVTALALLTGASEELFFRGTVHDLALAHGRASVPTTTAVYAATTCATGNPLLVFAAGALGGLTAYERRRTDSLVAPAVVHLGWSLAMILVLPRITARER